MCQVFNSIMFFYFQTNSNHRVSSSSLGAIFTERKSVVHCSTWGYASARTTWEFPKIVVPPKWMVKIMENPIKMDDLGGKPTIFGNIHMELLVPKVGPNKTSTTWINLHQRIQGFSGGRGIPVTDRAVIHEYLHLVIPKCLRQPVEIKKSPMNNGIWHIPIVSMGMVPTFWLIFYGT